MIRADDRVPLRSGAAGQQFMATVPAGVGEGAQFAVVAAHEQHAALADRLGPLISGLRYLRAMTDAIPSAGEEVLLFPGEYRRVDIGGPRQHPALAKRLQGLSEAGRVDRSSGNTRNSGQNGLTDHTVKSRQPWTACPARFAEPGRGPGQPAFSGSGDAGAACRAVRDVERERWRRAIAPNPQLSLEISALALFR